MAVDTPGYLLAVHVTPADEQERAQVEVLCDAAQQATGETVKLACSGSGNVTIVAKGIDGQGGNININVIGSQVQAGANVVLSARDQINLIASRDT